MTIIQEKIIVIADEERVLTKDGFKLIENIRNGEVRLFIKPTMARQYVERNKNIKYQNVEYKKVKITYEY